MHKMRGVNLDKGMPDQRFAEKMRNKRSVANREKNMLNFKENGVDLYSKEDLEKMAERNNSKLGNGVYAQ